MTKGWTITEVQDPEHQEWAETSNSLFASSAWIPAVEALGADCRFVWNGSARLGAVLAIFRQAGIRIGYLGFPICADPSPWTEPGVRLSLVGAVRGSKLLDVLRINTGEAGDFESSFASARPEIWIDDLDEWIGRGRKKRRKDLAYAVRANPGMTLAHDQFNANRAFAFYAETVRAHGGSLRYTEEYFSELGRLSAMDRRLKVVSALDSGAEFRGYAVLAIHGTSGHYLHGAVDPQCGRQGISDLLLDHLIGEAREAGCRRFTFMASPWSQPGLIRFKEKWGDRRGLAPTIDIGFGMLGRVAGQFLRWRARGDRAKAMRWAADTVRASLERGEGA